MVDNNKEFKPSVWVGRNSNCVRQYWRNSMRLFSRWFSHNLIRLRMFDTINFHGLLRGCNPFSLRTRGDCRPTLCRLAIYRLVFLLYFGVIYGYFYCWMICIDTERKWQEFSRAASTSLLRKKALNNTPLENYEQRSRLTDGTGRRPTRGPSASFPDRVVAADWRHLQKKSPDSVMVTRRLSHATRVCWHVEWRRFDENVGLVWLVSHSTSFIYRLHMVGFA